MTQFILKPQSMSTQRVFLRTTQTDTLGDHQGVLLIEEIGGHRILNRRVGPLRFLWFALFGTYLNGKGRCFVHSIPVPVPRSTSRLLIKTLDHAYQLVICYVRELQGVELPERLQEVPVTHPSMTSTILQ